MTAMKTWFATLVQKFVKASGSKSAKRSPRRPRNVQTQNRAAGCHRGNPSAVSREDRAGSYALQFLARSADAPRPNPQRDEQHEEWRR